MPSIYLSDRRANQPRGILCHGDPDADHSDRLRLARFDQAIQNSDLVPLSHLRGPESRAVQAARHEHFFQHARQVQTRVHAQYKPCAVDRRAIQVSDEEQGRAEVKGKGRQYFPDRR